MTHLIRLLLSISIISLGCSSATFVDAPASPQLRPDTGISDRECLSGERRCTEQGLAQLCDANGRWAQPEQCATGACLRGRCQASCGDGCTTGEVVCAGSATQRCEDAGNGCGVWGELEPCPDGLSCRSGSCECRATCMVGQTLCVGEEAVRTCSESGCWNPVEACPRGEICTGGICQQEGPCQDACRVNQIVCVGESEFQTCQRQANGCLDFSPAEYCPPDMLCQANQGCQSAACPTEACTVGETRCMSNAIQICETDAQGCAIWGRRIGCDFGEICNAGECEEQCVDECTVGQTRCGLSGAIEQCELTNGCGTWTIDRTCPSGQSCLAGGTCGECTEGSTEAQPCGNCGERSRTCQNGLWSEWSQCTSEGPCIQGSQRICGNCGLQQCNDQCEWGACTGEGECTAGEIASCGECGQRRCGDQCQWTEPCNNGAGTLYRQCLDCGWQFCCPDGDWCPCEGHYPELCGAGICTQAGFCIQ
ncbi:MAG: hypothetical protein ACPGQS_11615 [Bradymonadia bacterium]